MPTEEDIQQAVSALRAGEVIGLPTETVYGLAADATNERAVSKVFALKGRPLGHPLILHLAELSWVFEYCQDVPAEVNRLASAFWPGPLSVVLRRTERVPDVVTGGRETVCVRVPKHPVALAVLTGLGRPLAAPSANRFGAVSPTCSAHVRADFPDGVRCVLEGGSCEVGVESTILDLTGAAPRVLRSGGVTDGQLETILGRRLGLVDSSAPVAPGALDAHYAPRAELHAAAAAAVWSRVEELLERGVKVGVFAREFPNTLAPQSVEFQAMGDSASVARELYRTLRRFDACGCDAIVVQIPEADGIGVAVADRLRRAAFGSRRRDD